MHHWAVAQNRNNIWAFGNMGGFNFNSGAPVQFTDSMNADMACASVADANGNLLFYTNALQIRDRNNNIMPNGNELMNGATFAYASQYAVIVPSTADTNRYLIFYVPQYSPPAFPGDPTAQLNDTLYYSVVDMTLNNGLGDVVPGMKDIVVGTGFSTELTTVPGRRCNIWLLAHQHGVNQINAYSITGEVVSRPVISTSGTYGTTYAYLSGMMKAASNDTCIATTTFTVSTSSDTTILPTGVELYHFDTATGIVSNCRVVDVDSMIDFNNFLGLGFSPDNSKLYITEFVSGVYQYDLSQPTLSAITASKTLVSPAGSILRGDVAVAPDGKMYVGSFGIPSQAIDVIDTPNSAGAACGYAPAEVTLTNGFSGTDFPQVVNWPIKDTVSFLHDTVLCQGARITLNAPPGFWSCLWQDNTTADTFAVNKGGIYKVRSINECMVQTDSFQVAADSLYVNLGNDTSFCMGNAITLNANNSGAAYLWSNGSTDSTITVSQSGNYSVQVTKDGCSANGQININIKPLPVVSLGADTTMCVGDIDTLNIANDSATSFVWQDGQTGPAYYVQQPGLYSVTAYQNGCAAAASVTVQYKSCNCPLVIPNAFTPNGDDRNDVFRIIPTCQSQDFRLQIFDRWGQCVFIGYNPSDGWDGTFNGTKLGVGVYFYQLSFTTEYQQEISLKGDLTLIR